MEDVHIQPKRTTMKLKYLDSILRVCNSTVTDVLSGNEASQTVVESNSDPYCLSRTASFKEKLCFGGGGAHPLFPLNAAAAFTILPQ